MPDLTIVQHDFAALIKVSSENRPETVNDKFLRVDLWGNQFNGDLRFSNYEVTADAKRYRKAVAERVRLKSSELFVKPGRGKRTGTWVHPLIASHYASWLDADFAVIVNETFRKFLDADIEIAMSVIDRNENPEDLKRVKARIDDKVSNKNLNAAIQSAGGSCFAAVANMNNIEILGGTAKQIQLARGVKKTRDGLTAPELSMLAATENYEQQAIECSSDRGDSKILAKCKTIADIMAEANRKVMALAS